MCEIMRLVCLLLYTTAVAHDLPKCQVRSKRGFWVTLSARSLTMICVDEIRVSDYDLP